MRVGVNSRSHLQVGLHESGILPQAKELRRFAVRKIECPDRIRTAPEAPAFGFIV